MLSEKKNPIKRRLTFVFRCQEVLDSEQLDELLEKRIDPKLRGIVNWEID